MADNIAVTPGSGESVAFDEIAGVKHQRVKLEIGADGSASDVVRAVDRDGSATIDGIVAAGLIGIDNSGFYRLLRMGGADSASPVQLLEVVPGLFNGSTVDRERGNTEGTLLASAARTASTVTPNQTNYNARGAIFWLTISSAGTGTLQLAIYDHAGSFQLVAFETGTASRINGTYPGAIDADVSWTLKSVPLPRSWNAYVLHTDGSSWTYSLTHAVIV